MTYPEALAYLGQTRCFGMKPGLDRMRQITTHLGSPQDQLRFIHLAGTNGKGSTAAFCESCLRAAGFRVGLFTSPHLVSVRERIQVDRELISEANFAMGLEKVREAAEQDAGQETTFFEMMTALALWYFKQEKVEWVVWETGLGGRLDATNIVTPEVCIITNIGLDHQQYLGPSLKEIATEKAGIIKPSVAVISAVDQGAGRTVLQARAKELGCPFILIPRDLPVQNLGLIGGSQRARIGERDYPLRMVGAHQIKNAACAIAALKEMGIETPDALLRGLKSAKWPGRFEIISEKPLIVLDGAHNVAGIQALVETWDEFLHAPFGGDINPSVGRTRLVFSTVVDKDIVEMAQLLRPLAREVMLVRLGNERGAAPEKMAEAFPGATVVCYNSVAEAWAKMESDAESINLVTGSLFLIGEMLARRSGMGEEYRLNERLEKLAETLLHR